MPIDLGIIRGRQAPQFSLKRSHLGQYSLRTASGEWYGLKVVIDEERHQAQVANAGGPIQAIWKSVSPRSRRIGSISSDRICRSMNETI